MQDKDDLELEAFFDAARQHAPDLPVALRDRIIVDAAAAMPPPSLGSRWTQFRDLLGGWYGISGVATAGLVGLWIGVAPPSDAMDPLAIFETEVSLDMFSDSLALMEVIEDDV